MANQKVLISIILLAVAILSGCGTVQGPMQQGYGPMPPQVLCGGRYVPQGTCGTYGGQQIAIPQAALAGGSFTTSYGGRPVQCSVKNTALKSGIGALAGFVLSKVFKDHHAGRDALIGAGAGAAYAELTCVSADEVVVPVQAQPSGREAKQAVCKVGGMQPMYGVSEAQCKMFAEKVEQKRGGQNPCANQPDRIAVIRASGQVACRKIGTPAEPGEKPYRI